MSTIRRSTLQPISASQFNSRPSLGPSSRPGSIGAPSGKPALSASSNGTERPSSSLASSRLSMSQPGVMGSRPSLGAPLGGGGMGGAGRKSLGQSQQGGMMHTGAVAAGGGVARTSTLGAPSMGMSMGVGGGGGASNRADPVSWAEHSMLTSMRSGTHMYAPSRTLTQLFFSIAFSLLLSPPANHSAPSRTRAS